MSLDKPVNRVLFIITLLTGTFTMSISQSSLSTAYPTLMSYFDVNSTTIQWLTTGFMLVMCIMMPISPWLLNNISFKKIFIIVISIFIIGTIIIINAQNFTTALIGRLLEAVGVGILFPSFQSVLLTITPKTKRGSTMGFAGLVMGSALACGPIISGIVLNFMNWQTLFVIFLIIMVTILVLSLFTIKDVMPRKKYYFDYISVICLLGIIGLLYVINQIGANKDISSSLILILIVSIILSIYFVVRELSVKSPLLNLKIMRNLNYDLSVLITGFSYISLIVLTIIYPLYFQNILHLSVLYSGLSLVPPAILLSILNPLTGKLADRIGFKTTLILGMFLITLGWFLLFIFIKKLNLVSLIIIGMLIEGGNAFAMMPATTLGANSLNKENIPDGTAIITTVRQLLGSLGVCIATLVLTNVNINNNLQPNSGLIGFQITFLVFFIVEILGLLFAVLIRNKKHY